MTLKELQQDHKEWSNRNFGTDRPSTQALLGVVEEVGELAHAVLKQEQGIRGTKEEHAEAAKDAVGDISIYLIDYCNLRGWDFEEILLGTWAKVRQRDWKKNPKDGRLDDHDDDGQS